MKVPKPFSINGNSRTIFISIFFLVLLIQIGQAIHITQKAIRHLHKDLIEQAENITLGLNSFNIENTIDTILDTTSLQFKKLHSQLHITSEGLKFNRNSLSDFSSIYCIFRKGEKFFWGPVQTNLVKEKNGTPGSVYKNSPSIFRDVYLQHTAKISSPFRNNNGKFVSIIAPVTEWGSNDVLFLLGIDIPISKWHKLNLKAYYPLFILSFISFLIIICLSLHLSIHKGKWIFRSEFMLNMTLGVLLTLFASYLAFLNESRSRKEAFFQLSSSQANLMSDKLIGISHIQLESFARFFENSNDVEWREFYQYAKFLSQDYFIQSWSWIPIIKSQEMGAFESLMKEAVPDFHIWNRAGAATIQPLVNDSNLFPICYIEPLNSQGNLIGFNMGSIPECAAAFRTAIETIGTAATTPLNMTDSGTKQSWIIRPVSDQENHIKGFTSLSLDYDKLIRGLIEVDDPQSPPVSFTLFELRPDTTPLFLASNAPADSSVPQSAIKRDVDSHDMNYFSLISAFNKTYAIVIRPEDRFINLYPMLNRWLILVAGMILTILVSIITHFSKNRQIFLERVVAERTAALQESDERFSQITEQIGEIIWEVDTDGMYTYISRACNGLLGYTEDEIVNKMHIYDFHSEDTRDQYRVQFFEYFVKKVPFTDFQNQVITKNGSKLYMVTKGVPVLNPDGSLRGYRGSDLDITERKLAEVEKEKLQTELMQAQKMESIGRLAGGIAHDFNNMLCAIIGNAELALEQTNRASELSLYIKEILNASQRSSDLTRQLLAFARKQPINPSVVNPNEIISSTIKMLNRLIGENIILHWNPGHEIGNINIDRSQMDQLLANLVVNSRDAISGSGTITIETSNVEFTKEFVSDKAGWKAGKFVQLSVKDSGCGMDKETLAHIFEPFFTTKAIGHGTGLGLATVYGIVNQNNGFITVKSKVSHGTEIYINIPLYGKTQESTPLDISQQEIQSGSETILVVEDEYAILEYTKAVLDKLGYTVITASNPHSALDISKNMAGKIDLLLTDVIMPGMNGKELMEKINVLHPELKCLFMSGYTADIIAHKGVLFEGVNYIQKPFERVLLAQKIRAILDK